jgi:hypothetical protein
VREPISVAKVAENRHRQRVLSGLQQAVIVHQQAVPAGGKPCQLIPKRELLNEFTIKMIIGI